MLNRRELLRGIGAIVGVGVIGKVTATQAAPVEVLPVAQAPQNTLPREGLGSIVYRQFEPSFMGTGYIYTRSDYSDLQKQYAFGQSQLTNGRHIAPVLGGFDDDGGEG